MEKKLLQPLFELEADDWPTRLQVYLTELQKVWKSGQNPEDSEILRFGGLILEKGTSRQHELLLEAAWEPAFVEAIRSADLTDAWFAIELQLLEKLQYTLGRLFRRRAEQHPKRVLFQFHDGGRWKKLTWEEVFQSCDRIYEAYSALTPSPGARVAILSENRIEVALVDIMCIAAGIEVVPIQAHSTTAQIGYILEHAEIETVFVSSRQQLRAVESLMGNLPHLRHIVVFAPHLFTTNPLVHSLHEWLHDLTREETGNWNQSMDHVRLNDPASIMYTSGTTGYPKGICFTQGNLISKRFARGLVFPLGEEDIFLCYLPLYHTFGRFLELWGSIYWGARYVFARGTGSHSLAVDLMEIRPTILISIPARWQEIYERIEARINLETDSPETILEQAQHASGGRLRWGLSAAGYLDPDIFQFFQRNGIHLHSGYGMTEATGGITMTPRGGYIPESVGQALPGIEISLAGDGEMLLRGPYVSPGYWKDDAPPQREDGWFHTADVFEEIGREQFKIVDRKKEIYKNVKGQTIAPQKIENMFRDFDSIEQIFVVGDHRPYNTALIVLDWNHPIIMGMMESQEAVDEYISSLINSVNSFLAPFERITSFKLLEKPFTIAEGLITAKGTFRRQAILQTFADEIEKLYARSYQSYFIGALEVRIPNWFYRHRGWTRRDLHVTDFGLVHVNGVDQLELSFRNGELRIGEMTLQFEENRLSFESVLNQPAFWVGNQPLAAFLNPDRLRPSIPEGLPSWLAVDGPDLQLSGKEQETLEQTIQYALRKQNYSSDVLADAVRLLYAGVPVDHPAHRLIGRAQRKMGEAQRGLVSFAYFRLLQHTDTRIATYAAKRLLSLLSVVELQRELPLFLTRPGLLAENEISDWPSLAAQKVDLLENRFTEWCMDQPENVAESAIQNLLNMLVGLTGEFPQHFSNVRGTLTRCLLHSGTPRGIKSRIEAALVQLTTNFQLAMGVPAAHATAPGEEFSYEWEDVLAFDNSVKEDHRERIRRAFTNSSLLNECLYLLHGGKDLDLADLPPEGIWVTEHRPAHRKSVYRVEIRTRTLRTRKFALNVNENLSAGEIEQELRWVLVCGHRQEQQQIVERLGGINRAEGIWAVEFIPGYSVARYLDEATVGSLPSEYPQAEYVWPHFVWTAVYTYAKLWSRTRYTSMLADPNAHKLIIPVHDYHVGGRIVSLSEMDPCTTPLAFLHRITEGFLLKTMQEYPDLNLHVDPEHVLTAVFEALGPLEGEQFLRSLQMDPELPVELRQELEDFRATAARRGLLPKAVHFASRRYHRWISLNPEATFNARAGLLRNLYDDYKIAAAEEIFPDARLRLFLDTVFQEGRPEIRELLNRLMAALREHRLDAKGVQNEISEFIQNIACTPEEDMLLKRIAFPDLPPTDTIDLIATRSTVLDEVEIMISRKDKIGQAYRIRKAMTPKEIIHLQQLFERVNLPVTFSHEHGYLVAINENSRVIGGLFYKETNEKTVYMDKIVVSNNSRGKGVSRGLIEEFLNRMRNQGYRIIITGFLHPGFFYKFGFQLESNQAGLVKYL